MAILESQPDNSRTVPHELPVTDDELMIGLLGGIDEEYRHVIDEAWPALEAGGRISRLDIVVEKSIAHLFYPLERRWLQSAQSLEDTAIQDTAAEMRGDAGLFSDTDLPNYPPNFIGGNTLADFLELRNAAERLIDRDYIYQQLQLKEQQAYAVKARPGAAAAELYVSLDKETSRLRAMWVFYEDLEAVAATIPDSLARNGQYAAFLRFRHQLALEKARPVADEDVLANAHAWTVLSPELEFPEWRRRHWLLETSFGLPNWGPDPAVQTDMLVAANIMLGSLLEQGGFARLLAMQAPEFVRNEITRSKDSPPNEGLLFASVEGLISIVQSLNNAYGQLMAEQPSQDPDSLIEELCRSAIPLQMSRYLRMGNVGPQSVHGFLRKGLVVWDDEKASYTIAPGIVTDERTTKAAQRHFYLAARELPDAKTYLAQAGTLFGMNLSTEIGGACPIGAGIQDLTLAYARIYREVRQSRLSQVNR